MKLCFDKHLKDPTYYVQQGIRNGKKTTTRNVRNLGKHSELLKITDDPLAYVREEIRKMNEEYRVGKSYVTAPTIDINGRVKAPFENWRGQVPVSASTCMNVGYLILQDIMKELRLKDFFKAKTSEHLSSLDCHTISRFLTYSRILDPASKLAFSRRLDTYYEKPNFDYQHVLRFMDLLAEHYNDYLKWLSRNSESVVKHDTTVIYYDCTSFFFESNPPDDDSVDEVTGAMLRRWHQLGLNKPHRPNPLLELGIFLDGQGIPITMNLYPSNPNEQTSAIPLGKEVMKRLDGANFIYCADAGLGSHSTRQFNRLGGRSFIVTQSIKELSQSLQKTVFKDNGYRLLLSDTEVRLDQLEGLDQLGEDNSCTSNEVAYKVITTDLELYEEQRLEKGSVRSVKPTGQQKQRIIVTFSRKLREYQREARNEQIERAKAILNTTDPEKIEEDWDDIRRFLKKTTGLNGVKEANLKYELDENKIAYEEKYDGFYAVVTNLDAPARDILAISHQRYQLENAFRSMKTSFSGRFVNYRDPNRLRAHFLICYTALLVFRLLEAKLKENGTQVSSNDLIETLKNLNVTNVHDSEFMALYQQSDTLVALNSLNTLNLDWAYQIPKDLNARIRKILK